MAAGDNTQNEMDPDRHEMRTHLTTILGYGELLRLEDLGLTQREAVDAIMVAGRRLLELVEKPSSPSNRG